MAWVSFALLCFAQSPGRTAADTKLDLALDPAGFLASATNAYTPEFTLGQLQNQAYGYLFPQGLFFLITQWLPDWVAQRLWWTLVLGVGFSGFVLLTRRIGVGSPAFRVLAALLFALSPRTLTTLTAISSETWPTMLAPWVLLAVLSPRLNARAWAAAVLPIALMGAVNATATLLACLPAGIALAWRIAHPTTGTTRRATSWFALAWLGGCALVSAWWIGPLLVLGLYAAPFTEFIESAYVTTRWLNLGEILRGTTSWAPFVDTERRAGVLLVAEPVFVLATMAVAAAALVGLTRRDLPGRGLWLVLLATGVALLGAAHGPLAGGWLSLLDGPLAAFRNLHKGDALVRIPLLIGFAHLGSQLRFPATREQWAHPARRHVAAGLVGLVSLAALAPAWSGRLLPEGTWTDVPDYWVAAVEHLNEHAAGTRTLIAPQASFARQDWGWTRDEPAQPLLDVPWAVRDAIPLVDPEAIRGLDGAMRVLEEKPEAAGDVLAGFGIGAVLIRHDLDDDADRWESDELASYPGARVDTFGPHDEIEIVTFDTTRRGFLTSADPVTVAGGGEALPLLDALAAPGPRRLVAADADIVTDTPLLVARNYGTLDNAVSAPLSDPAEGADIHNRLPDYPATGPLARVVEHGGQVRASSSAAQASSFGGADPARSVTAAVDKHDDTAWWPAPGPAEGEWIELAGDFDAQARLTITATEDTDITVSTAPVGGKLPHASISLNADEPTEVVVPGPATGTIRVTLAGPAAAGIAELAVAGNPIEQVVTVADSSPNAKMFLLQRLMVDTKVLLRDVTIPRPMTVRVDGDKRVLIDDHPYRPGDELELEPGVHRVESAGQWVTLTEPGFDPAAFSEPYSDGPIAPADHARILMPGLSANAGLRAHLDGRALEPTVIGAGMQGFVIPARAHGEVEISFAGTAPYRVSLLVGLGLLAATLIASAVLVARRPEASPGPVELHGDAGLGAGAVLLAALALAAGLPGLLAAGTVAAIRRWTLIPASVLAGFFVTVGGAWLARAPWPSSGYAGDEVILAVVLAAALSCLLPGAKAGGGSVDKRKSE